MNREIKYNLKGQELLVIKVLEDGYLVCPVYEYGEDEQPYYDTDSPTFLTKDKVFDTPPVEKVSEKYEAMCKRLEAKNEEYAAVQAKLNELQKSIKEIAKYEGLGHFLEVLQGKVTHYAVFNEHDPAILKVEDAISQFRRDDLRMLSINGKVKAPQHITWKLGYYSDHSGGHNEVYPCTSYEMAVEKLREFINKTLTKNASSKWVIPSLVAAAEKYDVSVPAEYMGKHIENLKENYRKEREKAIRQLEQAQRTMEKYQNPELIKTT